MQKISKDFLEIINSLSWLMMDAMWMLNDLNFSYAFIVPTVLSGVWLIFKESKVDGYLVAMAALFWSLMNSIWLIGETLELSHYLVACKACFLLGVSSLIVGLLISKDISKTMAVFKRFRVKELTVR